MCPNIGWVGRVPGQNLCRSESQRNDIQSRECFLKDSSNPTTGDSSDYVFENETQNSEAENWTKPNHG